MAKVELKPAYVWDCESCGRENFARGLVPELSDEDLQELRDDHGVQPWETGDFMEMPSRVTCEFCGAEFETLHFNCDEPDSDSPP